MRNRLRIAPLMIQMETFWLRNPDWRFGQLITNLSRDSEGRIQDIWEWDVDDFSRAMRDWDRRHA